MERNFDWLTGPVWPEDEPGHYPHTEADEEFNRRMMGEPERFGDFGFTTPIPPDADSGERKLFIEVPPASDTPETT